MPEQKTLERATRDKREGKSPSTQAAFAAASIPTQVRSFVSVVITQEPLRRFGLVTSVLSDTFLGATANAEPLREAFSQEYLVSGKFQRPDNHVLEGRFKALRNEALHRFVGGYYEQ